VDEGGGVVSDTEDVVTFEACTFAHNSAELGGGLYCLQGRFVLRNCILWGNSAAIGPEISDGGCNCAPPCTTVNIYYCDLQGGREGVHGHNCFDYGIFFREGNIDADPCFADPSQNDYHLKSQGGRWDSNEGRWTADEAPSPCIDAGDPMSPIGLEPFPNGGRINMGAYGGTAEASKSYFGDPVCQTIVAGDVNGDCNVDFEDFRLMALHWLEDNSPCGTVTTTYLFQPDPNALTTSGGPVGRGQGSFSIEGGFELTFDSNGGTAWFERVDATLSREVYFYDYSAVDSIFTDNLDVLFQMTELVSTDVNETTIDFLLERVNCPDCEPPYTDIHLRVNFVENSVHLVGGFCDPCCDLYCFHLDAVAVREP